MIMLTGVIGTILTFVSNLEAIVATLGLAVSLILIGIGVLGWFVSQKKISLSNGIQYSIIWMLVILLAGVGYYLLVSRPIVITGSLMDNNQTRNPITGHEIQLYNYETGITSTVRTDAQGNFRFSDVREGEYDLIINGITVRSEEASSGIQKLIQSDISVGRFYLDSLSSSIDIALLPTETVSILTVNPLPSSTIIPTVVPNIDTNTLEPTLTMTTVATPTPTRELIRSLVMEEDFEDGIANEFRPNQYHNWQVIEDTDGNRAYLGRSTWIVNFGSLDWSDYSFEVNIKPLTVDGFFAVGFRSSPIPARDEQHYFIGFDQNGEITLQRAVNSSVWIHLHRTRRVQLDINEWNLLQVTVRGETIMVALNGVEFPLIYDYELSSGAMYFVIHGGTTQILFDDIRVWLLSD